MVLSDQVWSKSPAPTSATSSAIDRRAVVRRHNPVVRKFDPFAALTVGNGEFAFTADVTGLQTFTDACAREFPLCTTAQWAWHTTPQLKGVEYPPLRYKNLDTYGRPVPYAIDAKGQERLFNWLRENPHRMHLGRIALQRMSGDASLKLDDVREIEQTLDLWSGLLASRFALGGASVEVETVCHGTKDMLGVRVRSPLLREGKLGVALSFAYPLAARAMVDWSKPNDGGEHRTVLQRGSERSMLSRWIDNEPAFSVPLLWSTNAAITEIVPHHFVVTATSGEQLELSCQVLAADSADPPVLSFDQIKRAAAAHWEQFWTTGGAIDLGGSIHPQAQELERRIVLSQYNTAVHCAGSLPSQETGLLCNSWNGKFHLEMHWWHSAHFASWNRFGLLERSLGYYEKVLPQARELAQQQGFKGGRWPKMVGPDGKDSPSPVGPLLIWQQPHPIHFAELCYRHHRDRATLERWRAIVEETAEFMASYAHLVDHNYVLGPPMKTVSENADTLTTRNPTFELAYWRFGLSIAQQWRERLGEPRSPHWDERLERLSPLPTQDGLYLMQEGMTDTYSKWNWEHPALLMPAAMLPADFYDREAMRRTVRKVMECWQWDRAWGWDFGVAAAAAARVDEPELAIQALMIESPKNRYHPNGHNYQRENLTAYLPGNGSLLAAVATMAVTNTFNAKDWSAKWENLW